MMKILKRLLMWVCLLIIVSSSAYSSVSEIHYCGPNEIYLEDRLANVCEATCANPDIVCIQNANGYKGCHCISKYIRNDIGLCVEDNSYDCEREKEICPKQESLYDKTNCTTCERTCRVKRGYCVDNCLSGCYCSAGHIRGRKGLCIPEDTCDDDAWVFGET